MALNLVDTINRRFDDDVIRQISSSLGVSGIGVEKAVRNAVPAALAGMMNKAVETDGAAALLDTLQQLHQQSGPVDDDPARLLSEDRRPLVQGGNVMVSSLFGRDAARLSDALGTISGLSAEAGASVLSLVTPISAGVVGKQQRDLGLDASGLARLLSEQKNAVARALPEELRQALHLDRLRLPPHPASEPPRRNIPGAPDEVFDHGHKKFSFMELLLWVVIVAALAYAAYLFVWPELGPAPRPSAETTAGPTETLAFAQRPGL